MIEEFDYWFISFNVSMIPGNIILKQRRSGEIIDHGMNYASACDLISKIYDSPAILVNWQKTTERRYLQWLSFVSKDIVRHSEKKKFGVIDGEGKSTEKVSSLSSIKMPPEVDPPGA